MTNWTIFKIIFFHFYLYSSVLSHIYFLHIKNPLYNVKKTSNIEKNLFSLYFWGAVFSKITNSNAQKWVIFRKKNFAAKLVLDILATFWGACFLKCHRRPTLMDMIKRLEGNVLSMPANVFMGGDIRDLANFGSVIDMICEIRHCFM